MELARLVLLKLGNDTVETSCSHTPHPSTNLTEVSVKETNLFKIYNR